MGIRQSLNESPKLTVTVVGAAIFITVAAALALRRGDVTPPNGRPEQAFFSIDDGSTWFVDDSKKVPPFQKDGKQALRAYVYKCADGKLFVSCLARCTPQAKSELEAIYARDPNRQNQLVIGQLELDGLEVKRPGQATWLKRSDPRAAELTMPRCADGTYAQPVVP